YNVQRPRRLVALDIGLHLGKGVSGPPGFEGYVLNRLIDFRSVVVLARMGDHGALKLARVKIRLALIHRDRSKLVERSLLDREGDVEVLAVGGEFGIARYDLHIGKAILEVVAAEQFLVVIEAIGI